MSAITQGQVVEALAKVVEKYGADTRYADRAREDGREMTSRGMPWSCVYVHKTPEGGLRPGCIVGVVLHEEFGVPLSDLARDNTVAVRFWYQKYRGEDWMPDFSVAAVAALAKAQSTQDYGETWGHALIHARNAS